MDKIVKYIDVIIPMHACTLRCSYCYLHQIKHDFNGGLPHFDFDAKYFRKALSKKRLKGCARINFCGDGETLLIPYIIDFVRELLEEGHWIDIVTNGTVTKVMQKLTLLAPEQRQRLFLKISLHYLELQKRNLLDTFFENIRLIRKAGISYSILLTGADDYIPYIDEIKHTCLQQVGALPHISIARNDINPKAPLQSQLDFEKYAQIWSQFESPLFDFQKAIFGEKRKEFCMGGAWTFVLNMQTGELRQCHVGFVVQNIYDDIEKPISSLPIGNFCRADHCVCGPIWLTIGAIPTIKSPGYDTMRNRIVNGCNWLTEAQQTCMAQKLAENNHTPNLVERIMYNNRMLAKIYVPKIKRKIHKLSTLFAK